MFIATIKDLLHRLGIGKVVEPSSYGIDNYKRLAPNTPPPPVILMYSIGWCFAQ